MSAFPQSTSPAPAVRWIGHALLFATACNVSGWLLSLFCLLTPVPIVVAIAAIWTGLGFLIRLPLPCWNHFPALHHWRKRIRRPLPALFALLVLLIVIGGILHAPNNFDALSYRLPRIADWLISGHWEWIHAGNNNVNTRSTGFEWIAVPQIALLRTDRFLFLINLVSFLALPGLFFSSLRRFGVHRRTAAFWMWLLPAGYGYALQAGSIGNDLPCATLALAAFDFGFRWRSDHTFRSFALSVFACGLMTAVKPTTLPLLLPFAALILPGWKTLIPHSIRLTGVLPLAAFASFLPTAAINQLHCGDWTGAAAENAALAQVEPLIGLSGNLINTTLQNLVPPVFPIANTWNTKVLSLVPESFHQAMRRSFELKGSDFAVTDFQGEEWAGLGCAISLLFLGSLGLALTRFKKLTPAGKILPSALLPSLVLVGIAITAYFCKAGMSTVARHILPYYPFLIAPFLLLPGMSALTRWKPWRLAAILAVLSTIGLLIITPSRPLWPAQTVFAHIAGPGASPFLQRVRTGYEVYSGRADQLGILRDELPSEAKSFAYINFAAAPELPLWKPYLQRELIHFLPGDNFEQLRQRGVHHVVLNTRYFRENLHTTPESWVASVKGKILSRHTLRFLVKEPSSEWWVAEVP